MGMVFGKITVETPKYEILKSTPDYEIRKFPPSVVAEIKYHPSEMKKNDKDGGFLILAQYIGVFGKPQNTKVESIAMTAPVITQTQTQTPSSESIAMTAPVVTKGEGEMVTMQFILPSKYKSVDEAPKPVDERVVIKEEGEMKYGVVKFSGNASDGVVKEKVEKLKNVLENDGFKIVGEFLLARFNPPWTLPMFKTNEVMIPLE
ncbi:heme-binding-like protein At3g10130, chloroplastic [Silene latifolia]|uniref:heme-binding-like protein At3g10130, chloroplastic n=1 Tax=Silene latifolia TaxID=37657 RepID=UPI003D7855AB